MATNAASRFTVAFFRAVAALLLGLLTLSAAIHATAASAESSGALAIVEEQAVNGWPNNITFRIKAKSDVDITRVRVDLKYAHTYGNPYGLAKFTPGPEVEAEYVLETGNAGFLPSGTILKYQFTVEDAAGSVVKTELKSVMYLDTRFRWTVIENGPISLYYHDVAANTARGIVDAAAEQAKRVAPAFGVVEVQPIRMTLYNSVKEFDGRRYIDSNAFREKFGGQAYSSNDVLLLARDGGDIQDTARHELTHMLVFQATEHQTSALTQSDGVPSWLNEGLATYYQKGQAAEWNRVLNETSNSRGLLPLKDLKSYPRLPEDQSLVYAQGRSAVEYLVQTYGEESIGRLLAGYKAGATTEEIVKKALDGKTLDQLDAEWRDARGLQLRGNQTVTPPVVDPRDDVPVFLPQNEDRVFLTAALVAAFVFFGVGTLALVGGGMLLARVIRG